MNHEPETEKALPRGIVSQPVSESTYEIEITCPEFTAVCQDWSARLWHDRDQLHSSGGLLELRASSFTFSRFAIGGSFYEHSGEYDLDILVAIFASRYE